MSEGITKKTDAAWVRMIHYQIEKEGDFFYLCNQAVNTFAEKRTLDKEEVTCRNCLGKLKKGKDK